MFTIARPSVLWLILLVIPAALYSYANYKKVLKVMKGFFIKESGKENTYDMLRRSTIFRGTFLSLSWVSLVLALSGISFGSRNVPVQKSGNAICMVFDISWSMMAEDEAGGVSRLEACKSYAHSLVEQLDGESISIVLAKGDGVVAVPLTEDILSVDAVLESLSPHLMTSAGSSIAKGIHCAISTFPHNSAQSFNVWVFTDGDETDSKMQEAFEEAVKFGIPITVIGFGSEQGRTILSGDGKTQVHTKLQSAKIEQAAKQANEWSLVPQYGKFGNRQFIQYIKANSKGSGVVLLNSLSVKNSMSNDEDFIYEVQMIPRYEIFVLLGIIFFILAIVASEFSFTIFTSKKQITQLLAIFVVLMPFMFSGCSANFKSASKILHGTWNYHQKEYQDSVADFYQTVIDCQNEKNDYVMPYAIYGLASTYLMEDEYEVAIERMKTIPQDAPPELLSNVYYNLGIIANRLGNFEEARENFKNAILYDSENINAKINLELSTQMAVSTKAQNAEKQMTAVQENKEASSLEQAIFNLIKEEEQHKWKNIQSSKKDDSVIDY